MDTRHLELMQLLPRFSGGSHLDDWLCAFNEKAMLLGVPDKKAANGEVDKALLIRVGLEGEAGRVVRGLPMTATYDDILRALRKEFSMQKTQVYAKLVGRRFEGVSRIAHSVECFNTITSA